MSRALIISLALFSALITQVTFAKPIWVADVGIGDTLPLKSASTTVSNGSSLNDAYTVSSVSNSFYGLLGGGLQFNMPNRKWFPSYKLGVQLQMANSATTKGDILQFGILDNYHYQ
jgi:hypothetical protein